MADKVEFDCNLVDGEDRLVLLEIGQQKIDLRIEGVPLSEKIYSGSFFNMGCSTRVLTGGLTRKDDVTQEHFLSDERTPASVIGCLENIRLNGALLPFFFVT